MNSEKIWTNVCSGDIEEVKKYFKNGGDFNIKKTAFGVEHSLVMGALRNHQYETAKYLVDMGAAVAEYERTEVLNMLLDAVIT